jgi:hypothetical protein
MRDLLVLPFVLAASVLMAGDALAAPDDLQHRLSALRSDAKEQLAKLAALPAVCTQKHDTDHVVFHGCIDWHSSAHGNWALLAYAALTKDRQYDRLVTGALTKEGIAAERQKLHDEPYFEMPYGRAWFLRLAIAHGKRFGHTYVTDMADDVARSIYERYRQTGARPFELEYSNPAWAMINLLDYLDWRKTVSPAANPALPDREALTPLMRPFLSTGVPCSLEKERQFPQFMSICGNWAALLAMWLPPDQARAAIDKLVPDVDQAQPVTEAMNAHHYGLNFSRAWSAWIVYSRTGDERWARMFVRHMEFMDAHPEWWSFDYNQVGHWVAQFGIFAWERFLTDPVRRE